MSNVIQLSKTKRKNLKEAKRKGKTLCGSGFHSWKIDKEKVFDTKQGKLVSQYKCSKCDAVKVVAE
ncbi:MAG: hypothetical protein HWE27_09310 [Gammaproteobacteria bacterium]|nr:hypothetical protein [Gammaproteobacteria bacterium]